MGIIMKVKQEYKALKRNSLLISIFADDKKKAKEMKLTNVAYNGPSWSSTTGASLVDILVQSFLPLWLSLQTTQKRWL